ncbi:MAG: hypothetical protein AAF668_15640 [Pseudomonadota bacterium]
MRHLQALILAAVAPIAFGAASAQRTPIARLPVSPEEKVQRLLDRAEIEQVIVNYGLAFDM